MKRKALTPADFAPERIAADCAFAPMCPHKAILRQKEKTGWANLCLECYIRLHRERAEAWCKEHGLLTTADKIEYYRTMAKTLFQSVSPREHWLRNLERFPLGHIGHKYAKQALTPRTTRTIEREPGCDDE